jgi:hypothetical protein
MSSSGTPISPGDEVRVIDERGRDLADGELGELVCRGPYTIRGYYKSPEATLAAFTADGFYRMGDVVRKIGRQIYVEGRLKDLINRGGEKISSEEVENHLLAHPKIKSVSVVAMPDATFGEKACAFVILHDDASLSLEGIKDFLMARGIAKFKLPERLELVAEFPTSAAGKILRRELRRMIAAKLEMERSAAGALAGNVQCLQSSPDSGTDGGAERAEHRRRRHGLDKADALTGGALRGQHAAVTGAFRRHWSCDCSDPGAARRGCNADGPKPGGAGERGNAPAESLFGKISVRIGRCLRREVASQPPLMRHKNVLGRENPRQQCGNCRGHAFSRPI